MPDEHRAAARPFLSAEASARVIELHLQRRREAIAAGREPPNLPAQKDFDYSSSDEERE
jgi:hypothetical protein